MSSTSFIDEIKEQEDNIFSELDDLEYDEIYFNNQNEMTNSNSYSNNNNNNNNLKPFLPPFRDIVKNKVRQQLEVSIDSPFSKDIDQLKLRRKKEEKALILREETNEIRHQLDLVKNRLNELKKTNINDNRPDKLTKTNLSLENNSNLLANNKTIYKNNNNNNRKKIDNCSIEPKFRPLTGRADCPNCVCDRKNSICDKCIGVAIIAPSFDSFNSNKVIKSNKLDTTTNKDVRKIIEDPDERPIRPAKDKTLGTVVEVLDDFVVPGKVYTISKSLNEKRTKLAQAIDELENLMDNVKEKSNKLDNERKVVKLYKDQWQFGPNIGGPPASSRDRLISNNNKRNYESRLDPNLSRDTKSLMGFQKIETGLKLRQYNNNNNHHHYYQSTKSLNKNIKTTSKQRYPIRSKSLESLKVINQKKKEEEQRQQHNLDKRISRISNSNFHNGKSSSEINLPTTITTIADWKKSPQTNIKLNQSIEDDLQRNEKRNNYLDENYQEIDMEKNKESEQNEEVEEILNETIIEEQEENNFEIDSKNRKTSPSMNDNNNYKNYHSSKNDETPKVQKMSWIPVFGETEIKQVKITTPRRKVQIVSDDHNNGRQYSTPISGKSSLSTQNKGNTPHLNRSFSNLKRQDLSLANTVPNRNKMNNNNNFNNGSNNSDFNISTNLKGFNVKNRNLDSLKEVRQTLRAATSLLEQEQRDSKTKNQLIIRKRTITGTPTTQTIKSRQSQSNKLTEDYHAQRNSNQQSNNNLIDKNSSLLKTFSINRDNNNTIPKTNQITTETDREIARLEEKVNEQQKLLERLAQLRDRPLVSPVTVTCSSPCCHFNQSTNNNNSIDQRQLQINRKNFLDSSSTKTSSNRQLINAMRDRLQKTRLKLIKTLEEEIQKHQQLKESVNSSIEKQSNLEEQSAILKDSLTNCIDKCLKDLLNTFETLSNNGDNLNTILSRKTINSNDDNSENVFLISNTSQLVKENKHLKQMKSHIDTIERQRKAIFDELSKEKQRSKQLESKLRDNQDKLEKLLETKQKLESQLIDVSSNNLNNNNTNDKDDHDEHIDKNIKSNNHNNENDQNSSDLKEKDSHVFSSIPLPNSPSAKINVTSNTPNDIGDNSNNVTNKTLNIDFLSNDHNQQRPTCSKYLDYSNLDTKSDLEDSYNSIDVYRRYIQSMSPDIESIKRERKLILKEFDNIKRMLTDIDKQ